MIGKQWIEVAEFESTSLCILVNTFFIYVIIKRNSCHPVAAQSFHEKNVLQAVESFGKVFFDGVTFHSIPGKSFMQNWKQTRQGVGQQGKVMSRKEKLGR